MKKIYILFFLILLILSACSLKKENNKIEENIDQKIIATTTVEQERKGFVGGRDEHGCIPSAGYSWCESKQKCLRVWEEECGQRESDTSAPK